MIISQLTLTRHRRIVNNMKEKYTDNWDAGEYKCSKCGHPLFESDAKFKSGTQWPSFRKAMEGAVDTKPDSSHGMIRTELVCKNCGEHLGHVFDDGKVCGDSHDEAGKRFCILSEALDFEGKSV
jgi:peptide-methionine (R)-S-oxide reductase